MTHTTTATRRMGCCCCDCNITRGATIVVDGARVAHEACHHMATDPTATAPGYADAAMWEAERAECVRRWLAAAPVAVAATAAVIQPARRVAVRGREVAYLAGNERALGCGPDEE